MPRRPLPIISLFSGALGLDLGLERAGFRVRVAVERNRFAAETIRRNRPDICVIEKPLQEVSTTQILRAARLEKGEPVVITGGPSCQTFSTAGQRGSVADPRGSMFKEFLRVIRQAQPRFFVMENVRGVLSAAVRHRPLDQRGPGYPPLAREEQLGSAFDRLSRELSRTGYYTAFDLLNAADFGVPQLRERVVFIGSRDCELAVLPVPTHSSKRAKGKKLWVSLRRAIEGLEREPEYRLFAPSKARFLELVPEGGNWRNLPKDLQEEALGAAYKSWGGRSGFCRRLAWDRPSPALTSRPDSKATMFCHPAETRPLSVREFARLQQFPDNWEFAGGAPQQYLQVGNAVPVGLGEAIGAAIRRTMRSRKRASGPGVQCENEELVARLEKRRRTVLNPDRMRKVKGLMAAREWMRITHGDATPARLNGNAYLSSHERARQRRRAARVVELLHAVYGSPRHGNLEAPVDELIYILLSQVTTGPSYARIFDKLHQAVSNWDELADLPLRKIKSLIRDGGLSNQKAPRIKAVLRRLRADFGSVTLAPLQHESDNAVEAYLTSLPGIGPKTAKCIMMYSMGRMVLPVDTHVWRVAKRLGLVGRTIAYGRAHGPIEDAVRPADRYSFHVNVLEHGRQICSARAPSCAECALARMCPERLVDAVAQ